MSAIWREYSELENRGNVETVLARMEVGEPLLIKVEYRKGEWQNIHSQTVGIGTHWLDTNESGKTVGELLNEANSLLLSEIESKMERLTKMYHALSKLKK